MIIFIVVFKVVMYMFPMEIALMTITNVIIKIGIRIHAEIVYSNHL